MEGIRFTFLDVSEEVTAFWAQSFAQHVPADVRERFTIICSMLNELNPPFDRFDCIVSPANSHGLLDGAFDLAISRALSPHDVDAPTRLAQAVLYRRWRGYAPPGTCTLIPLSAPVDSCVPNPHGCSYIALCPTMRIPQDTRWDREVVYNCMWSLLCALRLHNEGAGDGEDGGERAQGQEESKKIRSVLMTGLATGTGFVSPERCAEQMALAIRDFVESEKDKEKWGQMGWVDARAIARDVRKTHAF
ncbi:macro domain-like protein [Dentipellis sp. KUC8613]|nr:macro domain-like protein [Dentipellis sp. KUC8613]